MLVVAVQTNAFRGEFLHASELPAEVYSQAQQEGSGLIYESLFILGKALLDPGRLDEFEDLLVSEALHVWNAYRVATPFEKGVPDGLPDGM